MSSFAEFFAGIGLVREAIEPLGWRCAFANDIAHEKAEMYTSRFGPEDLLVADIKEVSPDDLPTDLGLATASFPCIDLSLAGNRAGLAGAHSGTVWPFLELMEGLCARRTAPKALLIENVTGFLTSHGGRDLGDVCARLAELGYCQDITIVDARWFVPQSRPRLFVLAVRDDLLRRALPPSGAVTRLRTRAIRDFQLRHGNLPFVELPLPEPPARCNTTLVGVLEDVPVDSPLWWPHERVADTVGAMNPRHQSKVDELRRGYREGVGTMFRRVRQGKTVGELRDDCIAGCLRTPQGGSSVQFLVDARDEQLRIRPLTGREYARLQGALDYPIHVGRRQAQLGFGDAVCVPAVRWLVDHAFGFLLGERPEPVSSQLDFPERVAA